MECNFIHSYHAIDCVVQLESNPMHQASFPHMLYYIAKPYCSFVQNTLKPSLLSPKRMIVRRDFEGKQNKKKKRIRLKSKLIWRSRLLFTMERESCRRFSYNQP